MTNKDKLFFKTYEKIIFFCHNEQKNVSNSTIFDFVFQTFAKYELKQEFI